MLGDSIYIAILHFVILILSSVLIIITLLGVLVNCLQSMLWAVGKFSECERANANLSLPFWSDWKVVVEDCLCLFIVTLRPGLNKFKIGLHDIVAMFCHTT